MEIKGKVHCFFEQSGTFKNEFIKLGIPAEDYDIQNNFGQTDHIVDLFKAIDDAYDGKPSLFDNIGGGDLIMAFFPCIYFETMSMMYFDFNTLNNRHKEDYLRVEDAIDRLHKRTYFHSLLYKLTHYVLKHKKRLIIENPATKPHYLIDTQNYPKPQIIDKNRMTRGDYFKKPTAYWFWNCKPTSGETYQNDKKQKIVYDCKSAPTAGLCSEERSMISPDYARNFICDFILGKEQPELDPQMKLFQ
jgi:hypothetical protein